MCQMRYRMAYLIEGSFRQIVQSFDHLLLHVPKCLLLSYRFQPLLPLYPTAAPDRHIDFRSFYFFIRQPALGVI